AEARNDRLALNKAIEALERAGSGPNVSSEALTLFGRALLRNGQIDRAEQILQTATTRYPVDPTSFFYYASAAERQKHFDAARQALIDLAALQGDVDAVERATRIASLSERLNDPAQAARWYQKAVDAAGPGSNDTKLLKAPAMPSVACTTIAGIAVGTTWRSNTRGVVAPSARAAWTYSNSRARSTCPRTRRA